VHINGNAAPAEGDTASPHLTGQAIDDPRSTGLLPHRDRLAARLPSSPSYRKAKSTWKRSFSSLLSHQRHKKISSPPLHPTRNPAASHHSDYCSRQLHCARVCLRLPCFCRSLLPHPKSCLSTGAAHGLIVSSAVGEICFSCINRLPANTGAVPDANTAGKINRFAPPTLPACIRRIQRPHSG